MDGCWYTRSRIAADPREVSPWNGARLTVGLALVLASSLAGVQARPSEKRPAIATDPEPPRELFLPSPVSAKVVPSSVTVALPMAMTGVTTEPRTVGRAPLPDPMTELPPPAPLASLPEVAIPPSDGTSVTVPQGTRWGGAAGTTSGTATAGTGEQGPVGEAGG